MLNKAYILTLIAAVAISAGIPTLLIYKEKGKVEALTVVIKAQDDLIEKIAGERISIEIHTEIKNTAVLGSVKSNQDVKNVAEQQAAIIKDKLNAGKSNNVTANRVNVDSVLRKSTWFGFNR